MVKQTSPSPATSSPGGLQARESEGSSSWVGVPLPPPGGPQWQALQENLWEELEWRGFVKDSFHLELLKARMLEGPVTGFVGFDPTASSLHLGSLLQLVLWRHLQRAGHRPLVLLGGATGLIGDPKGSGERPLADPHEVAARAEALREQALGLLLEEPHPQAVNNLTWLQSMDVLTLLRDVGKHFSINRMLEREVVKTRLAGDGLSFTEFSYMLVQAFDFLELFREEGCLLQTGASDQWGNITSGADLIRKTLGQEACGLVTPLLTKADGTKFGKTESGTLWLSAEATSPLELHQALLRTDDKTAPSLLKLLTEAPKKSLERLLKEAEEKPQERLVQGALADGVVALVHGLEVLQEVKAAEAALQEALSKDFTKLPLRPLAEWEALARVFPQASLPGTAKLLEAVVALGFASSKGEARRLARQGGLRCGPEAVTEAGLEEVLMARTTGGWLQLQAGKRLGVVTVQG